MENISDYLSQARQFIVENYLFGDDSDLQNHTSFLENGIIDSTGILELIAFLETTYGIQIEDAELVPENLDSLDNIVGFLQKRSGPSQTP